ncbi:MAG: FtsX-like permease family protein [Alphaproteobacteria bacterium]
MFSRSQAIPLAKDASSRFLPWIVAFTVYLAALALAGAMALSTVVARWDRELSGTLTVQIPALVASEGADAEKEGAGAADEAARVEAAVEILRDTPGIVAAEILEDSEIEALLEPWLGVGLASEELPLPHVIDVMLEPGAELDLKKLEAALAEAAPGMSIDDHGAWFDRLAALARSVELVAGLVVLMTGLSAVLTVVFVTRSGLAVHHNAIELLHLIGAHDAYVASQFQFQALRLGLTGGVPGLIMAVLTLLMLRMAGDPIDIPLLPEMRLTPEQWSALAGVPVVAAVIAMVTARITVLRTLAKMP